MNLQDEILSSIEIIMQNSSNETTDVTGVVTGISSEFYIVKINGVEYKMKDGVGCFPAIGSVVWVKIPNGDYKKMYIEASLNLGESIKNLNNYEAELSNIKDNISDLYSNKADKSDYSPIKTIQLNGTDMPISSGAVNFETASDEIIKNLFK